MVIHRGSISRSIIALLCLWAVFRAQPAQAQTGNQAALVVVHGDGSLVTRCVEFNEPQISGYDVLQRSGLDLNIEISGAGAAICRIDHEGCTYPQQSCFCQAEGETYTYWSYWHWGQAGWEYSPLGASNRQVVPGAVEGWIWGAGTVNSVPSPPAITFAEVCAPVIATATETPTETPSPTMTVIPATPSATFTAMATPVPMSSPTQGALATATWTPIPTATATETAAPPLPRIELFAVDRPTLEADQPGRVSWLVRDATQVVLQGNGADQILGSVGNLEVHPSQTTTYVLVARNPAGEVSATVMITVNPAAPVATATPTIAPLPVATETATVVELAALSPPATPSATVTPLHADTPTPMPTATVVSPLPSPVVAAVTATTLNFIVSATPAPTVALLLATTVWPTATPDPAQAQLRTVMIFGGVALTLLVPMGFLSLAALFWVIRNKQ